MLFLYYNHVAVYTHKKKPMIGHIGKTINPSIILCFLDLTFKLSDTGSPMEQSSRNGYSITANSHDIINGNAGDHVSEIAIASHVI